MSALAWVDEPVCLRPYNGSRVRASALIFNEAVWVVQYSEARMQRLPYGSGRGGTEVRYFLFKSQPPFANVGIE
jgi:hypothetical protein